ncbi:unnamed protein product [Meloidogyne enterolobii]|uniref:Uncharacterized protein n=1 Tax=Meloidogyne enterolobii TaxID=390850 RepID=A0ACB0ZXL8_MELEN
MRFSIALIVFAFILVIFNCAESKDEGGNQEEIEQQYQNRRLRSLANGRWQLRHGKRFVPGNYYYQMMLDN